MSRFARRSMSLALVVLFATLFFPAATAEAQFFAPPMARWPARRGSPADLATSRWRSSTSAIALSSKPDMSRARNSSRCRTSGHPDATLRLQMAAADSLRATFARLGVTDADANCPVLRQLLHYPVACAPPSRSVSLGLGHVSPAHLNGALPAWRTSGQVTTTDNAAPATGTLTAHPRPKVIASRRPAQVAPQRSRP